jgi:hypothetical protein
MNKIKNWVFIFVPVMALCMTGMSHNRVSHPEKVNKSSEKALKKAALQEMVENQAFIFHASDMYPRGAGGVRLGYDCDVQISNDVIVSYLPFIGKAYVKNYGNSTGFDFTEQVKSYSFKQKKKGIEVNVETETDNGLLNFSFFITESGASTLTVSGIQRQSISYYGIVQPSNP